MPRLFAHILLSLLLLGSHQMLLQHGVTHWGSSGKQVAGQGSLERAQDRGGKPAKPFLHELCAECQADTQLTFFLPLASYRFTLLDLATHPVAARCAAGICLPPPRLFQPRAPPPFI